MDIKVNGESLALPETSLRLVELLAQSGINAEQTGIAVAVNMELVPRSEWAIHVIHAGDEIEVITARQGG